MIAIIKNRGGDWRLADKMQPPMRINRLNSSSMAVWRAAREGRRAR